MRKDFQKRKIFIVSLVLLMIGYLLWTQRPVTVFWAGSPVENEPVIISEQFVSQDRRFEIYGIG